VKSIFHLTLSKLFLLLIVTSCFKRGGYNAVDICGDWYTPELIEQETFSHEPIIADWWRVFEDPILEEYIALATTYNPSIKEAWARVMEARALRNMTAAPLWPSITGNITGERIELSENGLIPFSFLAEAGIPRTQSLFTLGFDAIWELDVFGKTQKQVEAAQDRLQSSIEFKNDILITIFAEVARNYIEGRGRQREIAIKERKIELFSQTAEIISKRKQAGLDSALNLDSIEAELARTKSELPLLQEQFYSAVFRLSVLLGQLPECLLDNFLSATLPLPSNPAIVPLGLRSDLLRRRPDIRRAERELAAYQADISVAIGQLFPSFSLFGNIGYESTKLGNWLQSSSQKWTGGEKIAFPIFQGGQLMANIAANKARAWAAVFEYERVILDALAETESAIIIYGKELEREIELKKSEESHKRFFEITKKQHDKGLINKIDLYTAERKYLDTVESLVVSETHTLVRLVALYKALGGGWQTY
jgi:multidrug efflux system outer membrane protein